MGEVILKKGQPAIRQAHTHTLTHTVVAPLVGRCPSQTTWAAGHTWAPAVGVGGRGHLAGGYKLTGYRAAFTVSN